MTLTIVNFRAFDRPMSVVFAGKTPEEMHAQLFVTCSTYIPTAIMEVKEVEFQPLNLLTDLINKQNDSEISDHTEIPKSIEQPGGGGL